MSKQPESTTKFKADISQLKASMQEAARQVRLANSEFKAATAGMDNWSKSADGLSAKVKQLDNVLKAQKSQLSTLEKEYELTAKEQGENSKGAEELAIKINNQKAAIGKTEAQLDKYENELRDCEKGTGKFSDELVDNTEKSKKASKGYTVMKGALANLVADGIRLATQALKDLGREAINAYKEFDTGRDNVIKATGATGEAADRLVQSYANVSKKVKGEFSDIGSTLGAVNTRFGFVGDELETATENFVKFAEITETDATNAVKLVSRAMGDAGIESKEYKELLDELAIAAQASGISVDSLTETLTKYGAPMRALGFDTKESIALFSAWEKAGVNTEIAFSGMKKAISNWGKANKDPKEEFKKTLAEIKKAPGIAEATTKSIEVFGAKAGPDLADAIQGGRFEYSDFIELLKNSKGTVKKTYSETQDGFDKVQLAIQKARIRLAEIVNNIVKKNQPQIEQFTRKAVEGFGNFLQATIKLFKYIINNGNVIISTLKGIAVALITYKAVTTIMSVVSAFQTFITAIKAGESAMVALNLTMTASPIGLIVAAVAGLTVGMIAYSKSVDDAIDKEYGLTEAQKENIEKVNELSDEYKEMNDARKESMSNIDSEYDHIEELKDEYNSLIDSNGKVKKGYKDRANFIINQLAKSMGVEREEIQKLINKNGKLGKSIDKIIEKKKAEAMLNSNEEAYKEAIDNKDEALKTYQQTIKDVSTAEEKYAKAQEETEKAHRKWQESYQKYGATFTGDRYRQQWKTAQKKEETAKKALEDEQKALKDAENTYVGYNATIKNYEGLSAAIISGDSKKIKKELQNTQNAFITAEVGTKNTLTNQAKNLKENYESLKQAVKDGMAGVSQADVEESKKLVEKSNKEILSFFNKSAVVAEAKKAGVKIPKSLSEGIKNGKIDIDNATKQVNNLIKFNDAIKKAGLDGKKIPKELRNGVMSGKTTVEDAIKKLKDGTKKELDKDNGEKKAGEKKASDFAKGIESKKSDSRTAGKDLAQEAKKGADTKDATTNSRNSGKNFAQGFINGMGSLLQKIWDKGKELAKKALSGLRKGQEEKSPSKLTKQSGKYFGEGYKLGIDSMIRKVVKSATNMGVSAVKSLQEAQQEGSPSKVTYKSGKFFAEGYINGIASMQKSLVKTVKNMVASATKELLKLNNFNFSEVSTKASSVFSDAISGKISYMTDKIAYQNEKKITEFDKSISNLEKWRDKKVTNLEKERDKKIDALEDKRNKTKSKKQKDKISAEIKETKANYTKKINTIKKNYGKLISEEKKYKEAYQKASSAMLSEFNKAISDYQSKAQQLIDDTINGITNTYQARYDELINKQDTLISKLKSAGDLFEISGAGVITVNDLKEQTEQIKDYASKLKKIKSKVSSELFDQITSYDMKEGSAFVDQLLGMSEAELKAYDEAYSEKMSLAESLSEDIYKQDFDKVASDYETAINKAMKGLPKKLEKLGNQAMKGFVNGLTKNTDYMDKNVKTFVKEIVSQFKKELKIKSPSRVLMEIGEYTGEGFADGLKNMLGYVKQTATLIADETTTSLDGIKSSIGDVKSTVGANSSNAFTNNTTIINNYDLVQNNTSPKPLSALETYKARRQQLAMVKAATMKV